MLHLIVTHAPDEACILAGTESSFMSYTKYKVKVLMIILFHAEVELAHGMVQQVAQMLRTRTGENLDACLEGLGYLAAGPASIET